MTTPLSKQREFADFILREHKLFQERIGQRIVLRNADGIMYEYQLKRLKGRIRIAPVFIRNGNDAMRFMQVVRYRLAAQNTRLSVQALDMDTQTQRQCRRNQCFQILPRYFPS